MKRQSVLKPHSDVLLSISQVIHPLLVALSGWAVYWIYLRPKPGFGPIPLRYQMALLIGLLITIVVFSRFQVYRPWREAPLGAELKTLASAWLTVVVSLVTIVFLAKLGNEYSRVWMISWGLSALLLLILFRLLIRLVLRTGRRKGWNLRHIVMVGSDSLVQQVTQRLKLTPWTGLQIQAFFIDGRLEEQREKNGIPIYTLDQLPGYLEQQSVDQIWIALSLESLAREKPLLKELQENTTIPIRIIPDIYDFSLVNYSVSEVAGMPVFTLNETPITGINHVTKRTEDVVGSLLFILILSPVMLLIAILIRLTSGPPILYRQERVSWNGKSFPMLKFRTMPITAETKTGPVWASSEDSRPTSIGKWLRKTSLDELPQLFNVLRGDMSLVGPRPERPVFVEEFRKHIPDYMQKHLVKAGLTGWAQVSGWRGDTDLNMRIQFDLYYIENWSLWFDLKILLLTPFKGILSANAY
ncbi:MAG: undecaprenyl-phosphate glucose phosphotransferase [FCB group bacterium]|nr:undecaprenyl-phosphate glucose phosphotransferase [FCB group bacterium]